MDMYEKAYLLLKFIILGVVQGFTEPIPISSSGHLILLREFFQIEVTSLSFEIIVHFGSLIAITYVYRQEIKRLIKNFILFSKNKRKEHKADFLFTIYLLIATTMTGIIGLYFEDIISTRLTKPIFIGISLIVTSLFLWLIRNLTGHRSYTDINFRDAVIIGLAQSIALIPGISRSGTTVVTAILLGLNRTTALKFSFLLFIPVSLGITVLSIKDVINELQHDQLFIPYIIAFVISIVTTYFALKWFINIMNKGKLHIFSIYCLIVGIIAIIFL